MVLPVSKLLDARTERSEFECALQDIKDAKLLGIDCETQDEARHEGLNAFNNKKRHVFDHRRTTMTGFSFYAEGSNTAWYVNLAHADVSNRIHPTMALELLAAVPDTCLLIAHNAPFELVMFEQCLKVQLKNVICSLQLAVTHHGPDEYKWDDFVKTPLSGLHSLVKDIEIAFANYDPATRGRDLDPAQSEVLGKFISKTSNATHSYNGFVDSIKIGYNLKKLVMSLFGHKMTTYEELLARYGAAHMGELTGEQVVEYGADDSYWAVQVYKHLKDDLIRNNPQALRTFFQQENPMIHVYADSWRDGLRLDLEQVYQRKNAEREIMADVLRQLKAKIKEALPFPDDKNEKLAEYEGWYEKHWQKKRQEITAWANSPDTDDSFDQCFQVSNPIGNAWATEKGLKVPSGKLNLTHYYGMRTILYDLLGHRIVRVAGSVSSDAEARARMLDRFKKQKNQLAVDILTLIQQMAEIEQRMKLYLTPYTQLMDPETSCVYPSLSSMLASRRMAMSFPNGMQLAKRGESKYIRGFYLADNDDHVVVSADWSSVELVLIGELSGDEGFAEAFGQLPYNDLHTGATVDCLAVKTLPGLTEEEFKGFKRGENPHNRVLLDLSGQPVKPQKYVGIMRTAVGKGANFNYWYSGALGTVGERLGWTTEEMWEATDRYRKRFPKAEEWRVATAMHGVEYGKIILPDHHERVRYEATGLWANGLKHKFADLSASPSMMNFADLAIARIQTRAKNQLVNSMIQGTCATLAKRTILSIRKACEERGWTKDGRFMMPIHDELVFSVHKSILMEFIKLFREKMVDHPEIVSKLVLDCTVAIGKTFKPYDPTNPAYSQIELDEADREGMEHVIPEEYQGKKLPDEIVERVIEFVGAA